MIVEDEHIARRALTSLLSSHGFHAEAYGSAEDALRGVETHPRPRIALVDVDLPGMSGLDFIRRLEKMDPPVSAVLITAVAGERIENFRRGRHVLYVRKPVDFRHLLTVLDQSAGEPVNPPAGSAAEKLS